MFGVGPLEVAVIILVAFLVLGPAKSIDIARQAGKIMRDLRGNFSEIVDAINPDNDPKATTRKPLSPPHEPEEPPDFRDPK